MIKGIVRNGIVLNNCILQIDDGKIAMKGGIPHGMEVVVIDITFDNQRIYRSKLVAQYLCQLAATGRRHLLPRELMALIWGPLG